MTFRTLSLLAAFACGALCLTLLLIPELVFWMFQMEGNVEAVIMSRRASMLFLGFSIIAYSMKDELNSSLRRSLCMAFAFSMAGLLCVGLFELVRGTVGAGIFVAIAVELFFTVYFLKFWRV